MHKNHVTQYNYDREKFTSVNQEVNWTNTAQAPGILNETTREKKGLQSVLKGQSL